MLRTFGRAVKKLRSMAGEFQKQFDDAIKEAELDGVKDTLNDVRNLNPTSKIKDHLNPIKEDLLDVKDMVEDTTEFDPQKDFDESKLPDPPEPVKVDVDAALERQRKANEVEKAELAAEVKSQTAKKTSTAKKRTAKKAPAKAKPTTSAKRASGAAKSASKKTAKVSASASKSGVTKSKKPAQRRSPAKKAPTKSAAQANAKAGA